MKRAVTVLLAGSLLLIMILPVCGEDSLQSRQTLPTEILDRYSIRFSESFQEESRTIHTFEEDIVLTGEAIPKGRVLLGLYTLSSEGTPIFWVEEELEIGASGLYQIRLPLRCMGEQQGLLLFLNDRKPENVCEKIIRLSCCRHERTVKEQLEEYRFNIYDRIGGLS